MRITKAHAKALGIEEAYNKHKNKKLEIDGYVFDSLWEADYYGTLRYREVAGEVRNICVHVPYVLYGKNGSRICEIRPDFVYEELCNREWVLRIDDCKGGAITDDFRIKMKLFLDNYKIPIRIVRREKT